MWWTAIALAAVAAWFEWTYRHDRKPPAAAKDEPEEALSGKAEKPVESGKSQH